VTRLSARDAGLLAATCLLALVLRLWKLDASLWYDEVLTLVQFVRLPVQDIVTSYSTLNNHVFFSVQAHAAVALFGESAWALRLPAALLGVATVPVLFALVRRIGAPLAWAHVSALLLAVNYHHIWFSQNARGYSGLIFWCLLATLAFVAGSRRAGAMPWVWFSLAAAAALYTHLSAAFYLLSLGLIYAAMVPFARGRPSPRSAGLATGWPLIAIPLTAVLVLALYAPMIPQMIAAFGEVAAPVAATGTETVPEAVPSWRSPLWTLLEVLRSAPVPLPLTLVLLPVLLLTLAAGFVAIWRLDAAVALALPVSTAVTLAILVLAGMRLWPRYFLIDLPFLLLFATAGTAVLAGWIGRGGGLSRALTVAGWTLGIAASVVWASRNYTFPKQDFQGAVALVQAQSQPDDIRASVGLASLPLSTYFAPDWTVLETEADLDLVLATGRPVWIVYGFEDHSRGRHPALMARLDQDFREVAELPGTMGGGYLHVLRSDDAAE
jgi:mannosyltransferase